MNTKEIIKWVAIAVGVYLVYRYVEGQGWLNFGAPAIAGGAAGKTAEQIAAELAAANARTAEEVVAAAHAKAIADANAAEAKRVADAKAAEDARIAAAAQTEFAASGGSTSGLAANLRQRAGVDKTSVDVWNWFLQEINPNAVVTDLYEVGVRRENAITADEYVTARLRAGLPYTNPGVTGLHGYGNGYSNGGLMGGYYQ